MSKTPNGVIFVPSIALKALNLFFDRQTVKGHILESKDPPPVIGNIFVGRWEVTMHKIRKKNQV
jgi:hypothetical protein